MLSKNHLTKTILLPSKISWSVNLEAIPVSSIPLTAKLPAWIWDRSSRSRLSFETSLNKFWTRWAAMTKGNKNKPQSWSARRWLSGLNSARSKSTRLKRCGIRNLKMSQNSLKNPLKTQKKKRNSRSSTRRTWQRCLKTSKFRLRKTEGASQLLELPSRIQASLQPKTAHSLGLKMTWLSSRPTVTTNSGLPLRCMTLMSCWKKLNETEWSRHYLTGGTGLSPLPADCWSEAILG